MPSTTRRRRLTGVTVGVLAAVALVARPALADTAVLVVDPPSDDLSAAVTALPASLLGGGEAPTDDLSVPADGNVTIALAPGLGVPDQPVAVLYDATAYERALVDEMPLPDPLGVDIGVTAAGPEDEVVLDVVVDTASAADLGVDQAYVVVDGVRYSALEQDTPVVLPVDLLPVAAESPAEAVTIVTVNAPLSGVVETEPGGQISVELPVESAVRATGVTDLEGLSVFMVSGRDAVAEDAEEVAAVALSTASGLSVAAAQRPEVDFPSVEVDGRTALLTLSDEQPLGSYALVLVAPLPGGALGSLGVVTDAVVELPVEPAPTPAPTGTAAPVPVPEPTVTVTAPPRRNPGLRSNTGAETAPEPALSDAQLVGAGAGLLLVGSGAAVVALRRRVAA